MRGEYAAFQQMVRTLGELPPRARRIHTSETIAHKASGTTSACAENTSSLVRNRGWARNYLRVRGEYPRPQRIIFDTRELPPRARRILGPPPPRITPIGTTSACAENTSAIFARNSSAWNYLRVRGEYERIAMSMNIEEELPPRARRIR